MTAPAQDHMVYQGGDDISSVSKHPHASFVTSLKGVSKPCPTSPLSTPCRSTASIPEHVCIFGSGIVGLSTAYYLLTSPLFPPHSTVTIFENSHNGIAPGASSFAGGFIAGGKTSVWHDPASQGLARLSWKCHVELAEELGGSKKWGWRECAATGLRVGDDAAASRSAYRALPAGNKDVGEPGWLTGERENLSGDGGIGQMYVSLRRSRCSAPCERE